ncbi:AAA family ATPase [Oxalobacteraceae bacterium OTU3CAMAD1]|nr:AAA family ATPase [Oxalobacteraceae bacterium OTU3CAMAD1]
MKLEKIQIENFKGLQKVEFSPTDFGCLVGENNAGKSSVLQAIVIALNRPSQIPSNLFYDLGTPVSFTLFFVGVTAPHIARLAEEHRERIASIVIDERLQLTVTYNPNEKVEVTTSRRLPCDHRYRVAAIDACLSGNRGAATRQALCNSYPEFATNAPVDLATIGACKAYLITCIEELNEEHFEMVPAPLPSGIASSITVLVPEAIYIPAVKNLTDDLKTTQSTSFGRLLALLLEDMTPDLTDVTASLSLMNQLFNRTVEDGTAIDRRHAKVRKLETLVQSLLGRNFPTAKVELSVPPPDLKSILSSAQIFVDDGSRDLIDNKGDGIKRSLTFALLQAYVHQMSERHIVAAEQRSIQRPLIFLFEEPELYLHPKSQKVLFNTLAQIASAHQVVVTTHSPLFFAPGITASFVRIAKVEEVPKPVSRLFPVNFVLDDERAETFRLARYENADAAFFNRRIVLFEGESDDAYSKHVAKLLDSKWDFDANNIGLVRVSGKGNFAKFRSFFSSFGIDVKIVADLDALFDGYQHLGASPACEEKRGNALRAIDSRIIELGTSFEPAARQIKDKVNGDSWKSRYNQAKITLREIQTKKTVNDEQLKLIDQLFTWEQEIARVRVCVEDDVARSSLVPWLDALRAEGICVLSKGAIEDYYPLGITTSGPKPERALAATEKVTDTATAIALSSALGPERNTEFHEIFSELFR